jgi:hypothetical protein
MEVDTEALAESSLAGLIRRGLLRDTDPLTVIAAAWVCFEAIA